MLSARTEATIKAVTISCPTGSTRLHLVEERHECATKDRIQELELRIDAASARVHEHSDRR